MTATLNIICSYPFTPFNPRSTVQVEVFYMYSIMTPKIRILFLSLIILLISNFCLFSQVPTSTNSLRHGDILCKIEVPYVEQGERDSESIWNLPEIRDDGMEYLQVTSACSSDPTIDDNAGNTEERPNVMMVSGDWSLTAQRSVLTVSLDVYIDIL